MAVAVAVTVTVSTPAVAVVVASAGASAGAGAGAGASAGEDFIVGNYNMEREREYRCIRIREVECGGACLGLAPHIIR